MSPMPAPPPFSQDPLRIEVCKDAEDLARHAAGLFVSRAGLALGARRQFAVALSGGETPRRMYALLTQDHYAYQIVWPAVQVYFSDERCVPPDDPRSNYRMAWETMLSRVGLPEQNIQRMRGEDDPVLAADAYERELLEAFAGAPRFDLVLLGMGADGHTASIFPGGQPAGERWVAVATDPTGARRLTLTLKTINAARTVAVLVAGREKADTLKRVLGADAREVGLPIQAVRPTDGQVIWIIDEAAASQLDPPAASHAD